MTSPALLSVVFIASNFASLIAKLLLVVQWTDIAKYSLMVQKSYFSKFMWAIWRHSYHQAVTIGVVLFGLEGVNIVFSQVSLNLLLLSFSSIFAMLLLTSFLQLSWLCGTPITYPVRLPFILRIPHCTCTPMFLEHIMHFLEVRHLWEPGTKN